MGKVVKTYEEFVNEEINFKKAIAGAALGAGLAFGSPNVQAKPISVETEQTVSEFGVEFSEVVELDSTFKKNDIYLKLLTGLRSINGCRILQSTPDKISCSIRMSSKPENSNGQTNANLNVYIKDGKFKVEFSDINFIYIGQQPTTAGQEITKTLSNAGRNLAIQTVSGMIPNRTMGNVVGQTLNQATRPSGGQKTTFTFSEAKSNSRMSDYVSSVESEMSSIVNNLKSNFTQDTDNW